MAKPPAGPKPGQPYRLTYEAGARSSAPAKPPASEARSGDAVSVRGASAGVPPIASQKMVTLAIVGVALLAMVASLVLGNWVTALAVAIVGLTMLQGLWRGAAEVFGVVIAMVVAVVLAPPLGRAFEGLTHSLVGTGGIANRLVSMGLVAVAITISLAGVVGMLARRWLKRRPGWRAANRYVGAGLGLVEGLFIAALLFWSLLMLEPIARSQLAGAAAGSNPVAERVAQAAQTARQSTFSGLAQATNPLPDMDLVSLIGDFAAITGPPEAREHFLSSEVIKKLQNLPSLQAALEEVKKDPDLSGLVGERGVTTGDVNKFLNSATVLRIIDRGDAMRDLKPLAEDLKAAIREAKAKIGPG